MNDSFLVKLRDHKITWPLQRIIEKLGVSVIAKSSHLDFQLQYFIEKFQLKYCLDIGAHHGEFINRLSRLGYPLDTIAFEPSRESFEILRAKFENQVKVVNVAITSKKGTYELFEPGSVFASLKRRKDKNIEYFSEQVSGISLQEAAMNIAHEFWDKTLLKVDVQGSEIQVLASGLDFLDKCPMVVTEAPLRDFYEDSYNLQELLELMSQRKFVIGAIHTPRFFNGNPIDCDIVFVKS